MSRKKFTTTFMCDIYVRSELFLIELDRLIFPVLTDSKILYLYTSRTVFYNIWHFQRVKSALSHSFIAPYLIFDSELSRFTSFPVTCSFPPLTPPRTGLCFPILSTEMRYHIRIVVPIVLPAGWSTNIDFRSKNSPRCLTNISYGFVSQKIPSPMLSLVGVRSYHPLAFDFNTTASAMNFTIERYPARMYVQKCALTKIRLPETISGDNISTCRVNIIVLIR